MAIDDDDDQSRNFPSFFKIIFEPRHELQLLGIPIKFMTEYGSDLLDVVTLKIPTGKTWKVELLKENGRVWFKQGWPEFVTYYSISHGHFLMFTYGGNSRFDVCIFDMTACEIEYPLHHPQRRSKEIHRRASKSKTKTNPSAPISSSKEHGMLALVGQYRKKYGALNRWHLRKINSYKFGIPCFAVNMQPSYVEYKFHMTIPVKFATKYLTNTTKSCTLRNATGDDTWPVGCSGSSPKCLKFRKGWKEFALGKKLRLDDICVFELIDPVNRLFNVNIIRDSSRASSAGVDAAGRSSLVGSPKVTIEVISIDN